MSLSVLMMLATSTSVFADSPVALATGEKQEVDCSKINGQKYELDDNNEIKLDSQGKPVIIQK